MNSTPTTITIDGKEYDLVPKSPVSSSSEGERDWEVMVFYSKQYNTLLSKNEDGTYGVYNSELNDLLSAKNIFSIDSVKRLSDGVVFSVGEEIDDGKIKNIFIRPINTESEVEQCWIECAGGCGTDLEYAEKAAAASVEPLFTTFDGKAVYEGDRAWFTNSALTIGFYDFVVTTDRKRDLAHYPDQHKYFSTEGIAKNYVLVNKPFMSIQDVMDRLNGYFASEATMPAFENLKSFAKDKLANKLK